MKKEISDTKLKTKSDGFFIWTLPYMVAMLDFLVTFAYLSASTFKRLLQGKVKANGCRIQNQNLPGFDDNMNV